MNVTLTGQEEGRARAEPVGPVVPEQKGCPTPALRRPWSRGCAGERSSAGHLRRHAGWAQSQISPERSCPWSLGRYGLVKGDPTHAGLDIGPHARGTRHTGILRQEVPWPSWADAL